MIRIENIFYKKIISNDILFFLHVMAIESAYEMHFWNLVNILYEKTEVSFPIKKINHFSIGFFLTNGEYLPNAHHDKDYFQELFLENRLIFFSVKNT